MRNTDDELADLKTPDDVALGILDGLAVFAGEHLGQVVHVLVEKLHELHENAGATLGIGRRPGRLCGLCRFHRGVQLGLARQGDRTLDLSRGRIEDVGGSPALAGDALAADEMPDLVH